MTESLIPLYVSMAAEGIHFPGFAILKHVDEIKQLIKKFAVQRVLDYGCGRGDQYRAPHRIHRAWGLQWWHIRLYDPAFPTHDERPHGKFDLVVCSDVLEHIPEDQVDDVIGELFMFAGKAVWASVCSRPAKKNFTDSDVNLHVTLHPVLWWEKKFAEVRSSMGLETPFFLVETP